MRLEKVAGIRVFQQAVRWMRLRFSCKHARKGKEMNKLLLAGTLFLCLVQRINFECQTISNAQFDQVRVPMTEREVRKRLAKAKAELERNPQSGYWHNQAGLLYAQLNENKRAQRELQLATSVEPNISYFHYSLGHFLYRTGALQEALVSLRKAVEIDPKNPAARFALGRVLEDKREVHLASEEFEKALRALEEIEADTDGINYVDQDGSYFSIAGLREQIGERLKLIKAARKK
jgi:tetratricopeptide (TPR) repeat protein